MEVMKEVFEMLKCRLRFVISFRAMATSIGTHSVMTQKFASISNSCFNTKGLVSATASFIVRTRRELTFEQLLDSDEAAALLKIHPKTLQKMARNGEIAGVQVGRLWRFRASVLNEWLEHKMAS